MTRRSGRPYGSGSSRTAWTRLKMAVFAPMPRAMVRMATAAKPGARVRRRNAYFMSATANPPAIRYLDDGESECVETSSDAVGAEGEVRADGDEQEQHESRDAHQVGARDRASPLRLGAGQGRESGENDGEGQPGEPGHRAWKLQDPIQLTGNMSGEPCSRPGPRTSTSPRTGSCSCASSGMRRNRSTMHP